MQVNLIGDIRRSTTGGGVIKVLSISSKGLRLVMVDQGNNTYQVGHEWDVEESEWPDDWILDENCRVNHILEKYGRIK
jgi:hypothetical protein